MIYVVVDERLLCLRDSILNGEKLLGYLQAWLLRLDHLHDASKMPFGSLQALEDGRMALRAAAPRCLLEGNSWGNHLSHNGEKMWRFLASHVSGSRK